MHIPVYPLGFSVTLGAGELVVRTRKRCYLVAFAVEIHLIGYPSSLRHRNRWAFIQFGDTILRLDRYAAVSLLASIWYWLAPVNAARWLVRERERKEKPADPVVFGDE